VSNRGEENRYSPVQFDADWKMNLRYDTVADVWEFAYPECQTSG
jgi:hypothetical protein